MKSLINKIKQYCNKIFEEYNIDSNILVFCISVAFVLFITYKMFN